MKRFFFCIVSFFLISQNATAQLRQVLRKADVVKWQQAARVDSLLQIEQMVAKLLHDKVNAYRREHNKGGVQWNESLALAARNHSLYMLTHKTLTHRQQRGLRFFTGEKAGDRLAFIESAKSSLKWTGENCLFNTEAKGKTKQQIAQNIADFSFEQWKNSTDHRQNMLEAHHTLHGIGLFIDGKTVYITDLFGKYQSIAQQQ
jgi:uncharacterized protein YkwD